MTDPTLIHSERELLTLLRRLTADRFAAQSRAENELRDHCAATEEEYRSAREEEMRQFTDLHESTRNEYEAICSEITHCFVETHEAREARLRQTLSQVTERYEEERQRAEAAHREARWEVSTVFEATKDQPRQEFEEQRRRIDDCRAQLDSIQHSAVQFLTRCRQHRVRAQLLEDVMAQGETTRNLTEAERSTYAALQALERLTLPKVFIGGRPVWILLASGALSAFPAYSVFSWPLWLLAALGGGLLAGMCGSGGLYLLAGKQLGQVSLTVREALAEARAVADSALKQADEECRRKREEILRRYDRDYRAADEKLAGRLEMAQSKRDRDTQSAEQQHAQSMDVLQRRRDNELRKAHAEYPRRLTEQECRHGEKMQGIQQRYDAQRAEAERQFTEAEAALIHAWQQGMQRVHAMQRKITGECDRRFPAWSEMMETDRAVQPDWSSGESAPAVIRFGDVQVDLAEIPRDASTDNRLPDAGPATFPLPALLPFSNGGPLLIETGENGSLAAARLLETLALRMLVTLPPDKVRFTFVDPVALGRNFASLMHLADFDEALVGSRIWTEPEKIEKRLVELTEQMETVIQTYLRNQFDTIAQYNLSAGEMAEPYRVLAVSDFPHGFSDTAVRRLVNIAASGPRCGMVVLLSVDPRQPLPRGFRLVELGANVRLQWRDGRFQWDDPDFADLPLDVDAPPAAEQLTAMLRAVGQRARDAGRLEVPFDCVVPSEQQRWNADSRHGIDVPLGRAGATRLQPLKLGEGTSQHVLVAGKTGSGKSTLLHAMVTSLALRYSPDEVQLYLVDFKKGVEFKPYAEHRLPHAKVVAIESEREFGLSVLVRLGEELHRRGDRFRQAGAQDVAGFRDAKPDEPLPRVLLVIDEFQELFVEDDKLAQDAALLLDRLVRQGRAFGIHVMLGSQTLGGAYSLARSTLGQMAVRIALACSESDAHLILSDENTAARSLSHPGEAIYNDAGGRVEGNHPFQVVWLPDDRRAEYLRQIEHLSRQRPPALNSRQIVFEGNTPAELSDNGLLADVLAADEAGWQPLAPRAWLGDAVAIKDPTAAVLQRHAGSNLLLVGQHEEAALGIMTAVAVSVGAQMPPVELATSRSARFFLLDGTPADTARHGYLASLEPYISQPMRVVAKGDLSAALHDLSAEMRRRMESVDTLAPPIFLLVHALHRYGELRKSDDEFGFSMSATDRPPSPAGQLGAILRDGPAVGIHTVTWCDSLNNLNRMLDRQLQREFELRVLFQMSSTDSSHLIDNPRAAKLGPHRALFYNEPTGQLEKFRPYGLPAVEWLTEVRDKLTARRVIDAVDAGA